MKLVARVFVAHPDDCIIYFWHLINSLPFDWEIVYLTHEENTHRSNEIKKFWDSHNVTSKFLGFADDLTDLKSGLSSIDSDSIHESIYSLVKSSHVVCTHSVHGEYGHPHHIQISEIVSRIGHPRIVYVSDANSNPDIILSSDKVVDHSLIPIHTKAVSHYTKNHQSDLFSFYNINCSLSDLIDAKSYEENLFALIRKLPNECANTRPFYCIIDILTNVKSSALLREICHIPRRVGNFPLAEKLLKLSEDIDTNRIYPFDWALIEKSKGNYRISENILLRLYATFKRDDFLLELLESAMYRADLPVFKSMLTLARSSSIKDNPRFINLCNMRNSYCNLLSVEGNGSQMNDFFTPPHSEDLYRSPKDFGELAKFHNFFVANKHLLADDLFIDYSNLTLKNLPPRDIFTFWDQPIPPDFVLTNLKSWETFTTCPTPIFNFDESLQYIRDLLGHEVASSYEKLPHPASQSDFFRLAKIYSDSGVYIDADEFLHANFNSIIHLFESLKCQRLLVCDIISRQIYIQNHFMIVRNPKDSLIECALNNAIFSIKSNKVISSKDIWNFTGPGCLTRAYVELMGPDLNSTTVFISSIAFRRYFNNAYKNYAVVPNSNWRDLN